ncbi:MAG TPA: hypothetical protein VLB49_09905 [Gemmatimonadales bacterium]|nr:hypothetical protein [Gemmatimonadales bacterium]
MNRISLVSAALLLAGSGLAAQQNDPDRSVQGGGVFPEGWNVRTERNAPTAQVKFVAMGGGFHATMGPAAIMWRDADVATGNYHTVATFAQTKAPTHPEAYGLIIGGQHLADSAQSYTYFLVRGQGEFSIRRRAGYASRPTAVVEWTANAAVHKADSAGAATNELAVLIKDGKASFTINGTEVYSTAATNVDASGIVGYRVNHNLDVHLSAIGIHKLP